MFDRNRHYIIRRSAIWAVFYASYLYIAGHTTYALKKGYIPMVDMENYPRFIKRREPLMVPIMLASIILNSRMVPVSLMV